MLVYLSSWPSHVLQYHNVSFVGYHLLGYFMHLSGLQHSAYTPSSYRDSTFLNHLLDPFPIRFIHSRLFVRFLTKIAFYKMGLLVHAEPATWRTRLSILVWTLFFDSSDMDGPTGSYTTVCIALRVTVSDKPHHHHKGRHLWGKYEHQVHIKK